MRLDRRALQAANPAAHARHRDTKEGGLERKTKTTYDTATVNPNCRKIEKPENHAGNVNQTKYTPNAHNTSGRMTGVERNASPTSKPAFARLVTWKTRYSFRAGHY